jgi:isoquinoline 1-oxidoreductase alpha subunit
LDFFCCYYLTFNSPGPKTRTLQDSGGSNVITVEINGQTHDVDVDPNTPLLWVLRDHLKMTGTKFGCGRALCGACTIYLNGSPTRSCVLPVSAAQGQRVTTIEGLQTPAANAIQAAWQALDVPQCGYCQSGQIMSATALLETKPMPTDADIDAAMQGIICRCATYGRIRKAIHTAAGNLGG